MGTTETNQAPLMVLAIGGNALIPDNDHFTLEKQKSIVTALSKNVVDLIESGWRIVLTHGNGPHVGIHLLRSELGKRMLPKLPLDHAVSSTQGEIGYLLQSALRNELIRRNIQKPVVSLITQVEIYEHDEAFNRPDKPVGAFLSREEAEKTARELGWQIIEDSGRGWRRVVPSPKPMKILEIDVIQQLLDSGTLVIACGGGGIPVIKNSNGMYSGIEAVIDKDRVSALLAATLQADLYLIPTGVEQIALHFGKANQEWLSRLSVEEAKKYILEGEFPRGSMLPKIEAILDYLKACPKGNGLVTSLNAMNDAIKGTKGTRIYTKL